MLQPPSEDEVVPVSIRSLLLTTMVCAVLVLMGIWVVRFMASENAGFFIWIWGSVWFLLAGVGLFAGLWGLLVSRPRFARLGEDGLQFYQTGAPAVAWSGILGVRLGSKTIHRDNGTTLLSRHPVVLRLRDLSGQLENELRPRSAVSRLPDGTLEWRVFLGECSCPESDLVAKIQARVDPETIQSATEWPEPVPKAPDRPRPPRRLVALLVCAPFVASGLHIALEAAKAYPRCVDSIHWPVVKGTITERTLTRIHPHSRKLNVRYLYTVNGRLLTGNRISFTHHSDGSFHAQFLQKGDVVSVSHNPADPADSVLLPEHQNIAVENLVVGVLFSIIGCLACIRHFQAFQKFKASHAGPTPG